ncbi:MAG: hypothetical protein M3Y24_07375 [Acidobacteriota bacterium]|nr:hypothetical protein [Acidobacteriota bacterium]
MEFGQDNSRSRRLAQLWHFDPHSLTLVFRSGEEVHHLVDLRRITSSTCMLDIIFDISGRPWASKDIIGDLIQALQELFDPKVTLCGAGRDRLLDPVVHLVNRRVQ